MKVPKEDAERFALYADIKNKCMASRDDRKVYYKMMRDYYLQGTTQTDLYPIYNNCYPHIDTLCSFLYAQDTTKFSLIPGADTSKSEFPKINPAQRRVQQEWHDSNGDVTFGDGVRWALVKNTSIIKLMVKNKSILPYVCGPENFGVLREDVSGLDRQQACAMFYNITRSALESQLSVFDEVKRQSILDRVTFTNIQNPNEEDGLARIVTNAVSPNIIGNVDMSYISRNTEPVVKVAEPMAQMSEVYIFDDEKEDYRILTMAEPDVVIFERSTDEVFLKNELPFVQICPNPSYDYFWGHSEMGYLVPLQEMLNERIMGIKRILARQADPPTAGYGVGMSGPQDERQIAWMAPGSQNSFNDPTGKIEVLESDVANDLWTDVKQIMDMFGETSGISPIMQGKGEQGVRSLGHAQELAHLGSSRPKKRALIIEDALEKMATLYFKLLSKYNDDHLQTDDGMEFVLNQMDPNFSVKVDAHSSSPVFNEDQKELALKLFEAGVIDGESLLDMTQPTMLELLKAKYRDMQARKASMPPMPEEKGK